MSSFFKKIWGYKLIKYLLVVISLLFIAGGAFNDGPTGSYFAAPFIFLFYFSLPFNNKKKVIISLIILVIATFISEYKYESSIVFPVIGQRVTILEDIPINGYNRFDDFFYTNLGEGKNISSMDHIPKGQIYYVERMESVGQDFGTYYNFIFSNGSREFKVKDWSLAGFPSFDKEEKLKANFCSKVRWDYCDQGKFDNNYNQLIYPDVMFYPFRLVSELMWYPALPFLLYGWIRN